MAIKATGSLLLGIRLNLLFYMKSKENETKNKGETSKSSII